MADGFISKINSQDTAVGFADDGGSVYRIIPDGDHYQFTKNGTLTGLPKMKTVAVTGTTHTLAEDEIGSLLICSNAASVTVTLPAVATSAGWWCHIIRAADEEIVVTAPANTLVAGNDATATSITYTTASEHVGQAFTVVCDGTLWYLMNHLALEAFTGAVA